MGMKEESKQYFTPKEVKFIGDKGESVTAIIGGLRLFKSMVQTVEEKAEERNTQ